MRVLTGLRVTNKIHIGNFIGSLKQLIDLEKKQNGEIFLFAADLHSLTEGVCKGSLNFIRNFLAFLDNKNYFYIQSEFSQIAHLSWMLCCSIPAGSLFRMTQFKSKAENQDVINSGFLFYPCLMAADILIAQADFVPVGFDQKQHLELTRDICRYFDQKFNFKFKEPKPLIHEETTIKDLQTGNKMSKSSNSELGTIFIEDNPDIINKKIKKAKTDSLLMPSNILEIQHSRPEIYNLCLILKEMDYDFEEIESNFGGRQISYFKDFLTEFLVEKLSEMQKKINQVTLEDARIVLNSKKNYLNEEFNKTINTLQKKIILDKY